jgi:ABC-type glycerol-3-phosphate transport system permease component
MGISPELTESARIDGASELRILLTVIMPLSRAVIAVISLFYAVGYWSAWFNASIKGTPAASPASAARRSRSTPPSTVSRRSIR